MLQNAAVHVHRAVRACLSARSYSRVITIQTMGSVWAIPPWGKGGGVFTQSYTEHLRQYQIWLSKKGDILQSSTHTQSYQGGEERGYCDKHTQLSGGERRGGTVISTHNYQGVRGEGVL